MTATIEGDGKSVTYRGICTVHDDAQTKRWFYPALGERRFPDDDAYRAEFVRKLDSERRVILEREKEEARQKLLVELEEGQTRNGTVQEVGIVDGRLAATRSQQRGLLRFF